MITMDNNKKKKKWNNKHTDKYKHTEIFNMHAHSWASKNCSTRIITEGPDDEKKKRNQIFAARWTNHSVWLYFSVWLAFVWHFNMLNALSCLSYHHCLRRLVSSCVDFPIFATTTTTTTIFQFTLWTTVYELHFYSSSTINHSENLWFQVFKWHYSKRQTISKQRNKCLLDI